MGVGVTASTRAEAEQLAQRVAGEVGYELSERVIEDIDVSTLDANHVLGNMGISSVRGVWFPQGFQHLRANT
jgi:hypothetical protein